MNKYICKAMLYNKLKDMYIIAFLTLGFFLINILVYSLDKYSFGNADYMQLLEIPLPFFVFMILGYASDLYNKKENSYYYLLTTPITRDSIVITNILIPMIPTTISILLYGLITNIILILNGINSSIAITLWLNIIFTLSILLLANTTMQIFQIIMSKYITALLIPLMYISFIIPTTIVLIANLIFDIFNKPYILNLDINFSFLGKPLLLSTFLIIISLIFSFFAIILNRKLKLENINKMFAFKCAENIFKIITSLFTSTIVVFMSAVLLKLDTFVNNSSLVSLIILVLIIIFTFILYILLNKLFFRKTA